MSWRAKIYRADTREFLAALTTRGQTLRDAETRAVSITALMLRADPRTLVVRHLAQLSGRKAKP